MTTMTGFAHPVFGTQLCFRKIVKAMSEPGSLVTVPNVSGLESMSSATAATLLTLTSHTTPLFIDPKIGNPLLLRTLCLHTNVPIATRLDEADFVLLSGNRFSYDLMALSCGSEAEPEKSTTVIVEVEGMHDGPCLKLTGPGIKTHRIISPRLPGGVRDYLCNRPHAFPTGLDFLFTSGKKLFAIPRSTHVEEC
ncbi:phosphonate C-P lyase system protein PhnH [Pectobacterium brasiliense]|uniref:phosphonate C-P lyase system protein PhnH n=1 Tax=Pectobacterium brasiliense TaxID=180957 RepID=UPI001968F0E7|nr:phosphonate C-P lyase system protein PhnH [Pectobacterium brasiliense]MBN3254956.1 phosphonate C-P lyase system protein PhnH [Pectobacterium brasiliense]